MDHDHLILFENSFSKFFLTSPLENPKTQLHNGPSVFPNFSHSKDETSLTFLKRPEEFLMSNQDECLRRSNQKNVSLDMDTDNTAKKSNQKKTNKTTKKGKDGNGYAFTVEDISYTEIESTVFEL